MNNINNPLNLSSHARVEKVLTMPHSKVIPEQTIEVWDEPISLSFDKNKEIIAKLWFDTPSEIAIALNEETETINLEKLKKGLNRKSVTNLTVITRNTSGEKIQHHIKVITRSGKSKYEEVEMINGEVKIIR